MTKEIEELYGCLARLEEAYKTEAANSQSAIAVDEARLKLELAVSRIEELLTQTNV